MKFVYGFIVGMWFITVLVYIFPDKIRPVNEYLVEKGHGYYHPATKDFVLKSVKRSE